MFQTAIEHYLSEYDYSSLNLKAVFFDMDGVLFDSMPYHAEAWHQTMKNRGLYLSREEAYLYEGRTGASTITIVTQREWGRDATNDEIEAIYKEKTQEFNKHPEAGKMPGAWELLQKVKDNNLIRVVVTGSGQDSLLNRLNSNFPGIFSSDLMVTAYDVKFGKPNPEPYLMALQKAGLSPNEAIVVENAPLGVESAVAAGLFTIAVNTGPLEDAILVEKGANYLFPSMEALNQAWDTIVFPGITANFGLTRK